MLREYIDTPLSELMTKEIIGDSQTFFEPPIDE